MRLINTGATTCLQPKSEFIQAVPVQIIDDETGETFTEMKKVEKKSKKVIPGLRLLKKLKKKEKKQKNKLDMEKLVQSIKNITMSI